MKLRKCKACISRVKSRTGGDFRPTGAIFCLTLSILCLIHGEHSVTTASSSVHPSLTRAATRPLLEPTTVLPRPCPPQPTAYTGGATKRGGLGGRRLPPSAVTTCCQPGAATGEPLTPRTGTAVSNGTDRTAAPAPSRRRLCTLARAAAAAAARRCWTHGRCGALGGGWYTRQASLHLNRRDGARLAAAAARGWGASETLRHRQPPRWPS